MLVYVIQISLFAVLLGSFAFVLIGITTLLAWLRQSRLHRRNTQIHPVQAVRPPLVVEETIAPMPASRPALKQPTQEEIDSLAETTLSRSQRRQMVSEHVTISIEPDEAIFLQRQMRKRQNVQRIIKHLKEAEIQAKQAKIRAG